MRKLSDGILPCGRCGQQPEMVGLNMPSEVKRYYAICLDCDVQTDSHNTVADTIVEWNNLSAATHPEPEDYLELLEECWDDYLIRRDLRKDVTPWFEHAAILNTLRGDYDD